MTDLVSSGDLQARMNYAQALAASSLLPSNYRKQPANVLVAIEYGQALGLAPMVAIQTIHVVDGKPTASAQLIGSLVRRAGHRLRVTGDKTHAIAEIIRSDDPDFAFRAEWNLERAEAAGLLGKGPWKQYPDAMLKARAITEVARDACPEVLAGVAYTPEELGHDVDASFSRPNPQPSAHGQTFDAQPEPESIHYETGEIVEPQEDPTRPGGSDVISAIDIDRAVEIMRRDGATPKQINAVSAYVQKAGGQLKFPLAGLGIIDVVSDMVGRDLIGLDDLTKKEASDIIEDAVKNESRHILEIIVNYMNRAREASNE